MNTRFTPTAGSAFLPDEAEGEHEVRPYEMLISLLMPMRDARPYVEASLRSALAQAGIDLEVVVIDDGSTDGSADVVRGVADPRVRIVPGPCTGISNAMNAGLAAARGELICRCDADDLYPAGRLARQSQWLADHPDFGGICGSFSTITSKGQPIADLDCGPAAAEVTGELRQARTRTHLCTWLVRADAVRQAGGFRPWFVTAEDIDLQLRLGGVCRVWYEPVVCYAYRLHDASITHQQATNRRLFYENTARTFARQRAEMGTDDLQRGAPPEPPAAEGSAATTSTSHVQDMLVGAAWREHRQGRKMRALRTGLRACMTRPANLSAWRSLAALAVRRSAKRAP